MSLVLVYNIIVHVVVVSNAAQSSAFVLCHCCAELMLLKCRISIPGVGYICRYLMHGSICQYEWCLIQTEMYVFNNVLDLESAEDLYQRRVTRVITNDFPVYFALVTRIRQESKVIGMEGGLISSTVVPQVQAVFPDGAIQKSIRVGVQVIKIL